MISSCCFLKKLYSCSQGNLHNCISSAVPRPTIKVNHSKSARLNRKRGGLLSLGSSIGGSNRLLPMRHATASTGTLTSSTTTGSGASSGTKSHSNPRNSVGATYQGRRVIPAQMPSSANRVTTARWTCQLSRKTGSRSGENSLMLSDIVDQPTLGRHVE